MKDLYKFNIPKKNVENVKEAKKLNQVNTRKKQFIIIAIIFFLIVAISLKLLLAENPANAKEIIESENTSKKKHKADAKSDSKKMLFTFYDHLKNESVKVNILPFAQRNRYKYSYIYQIVSFKNINKTNHYVKKMKAEGLEPKFKKIGSWIIMYIGPYDNIRAVASDIIKLQRIGLNGGLIREISHKNWDKSHL